MSLRRLVVELDLDGLNVTRFCAEHGISTWSFYELRRRFAAEGLAGLEPRSRAPHRVANRTPVEVEDVIVEVRKELDAEGLDAGPATIQWHLGQRDLGVVVSEATIWRVLSRRGFVTPDPAKAPKHAGRRFAAERANECWQLDDTGWELADGRPVKIVNVIDDCTRVAVASRAAYSPTAAAIFEAFTDAAAEWGWPERVLCDNAKAHRYTLTDALAELGIGIGHSRPYHPQTCGKVERFHLSVKRYLSAQDPPETLADLQTQLDRFRHRYNHDRPHRSLNRRIPTQVWAATPKSGPASQPLNTPTRIHHATVARNGVVSAGRRYAIHLGVAYAHQTAITVITGTACHVFIDAQLIRKLTLNPTRRHQTLHPRPGRPAKL
jgi:transposase InsO family protein